MEDIQQAMDELLADNPEFTFFETCAEMVKKGEINYDALDDPGVHTLLYQLFARAKTRGQLGRMNQDI